MVDREVRNLNVGLWEKGGFDGTGASKAGGEGGRGEELNWKMCTTKNGESDNDGLTFF